MVELTEADARLKQEIEKRSQAEKSFRALVENANDGIILIKMDGDIVYANRCFGKISEYNDLGLQKTSINKLIETTEREKLWERLRGRLGENPVPNRFELNLITQCGRAVPVEVTAAKTIWQGQPVLIMVVRDITSQKQTEANLITKQIKLEYSVKIRTKQLVETNNALSVLARNIDHKGEETQKQTARIINSKILPVIERFQKSKDFAEHWTEFDLLKVYLKELTSHPTSEPAAISMLTTAELRVASMIKNGFNNSEIARRLFVSVNTVKTHRRNIRKKLYIRNSKINLASYLRAKMRWPPGS
jgi:PAS domain S-box-containing protein